MSSARASGRLWSVLASVFAFAVLLFVVGLLVADGKRGGIGFEAAKVGLQLGVITVFGAAVSEGLKRFDAERQQREKLHEYRLTVFRDAVDAHNKIKTVRRALRASGFGARIAGCLSAGQIEDFHEQMWALNDAELLLEKIGHEVDAQKEVLPEAASHLPRLYYVQRYLRHVLGMWEEKAAAINTTSEPPPELLERLKTFLARKTAPENFTPYWQALIAFEGGIRADLTGLPRPKTQSMGEEEGPQS